MQAQEAFGMLDEDDNGQLTLQELRDAVANILRCVCLRCARTGKHALPAYYYHK